MTHRRNIESNEDLVFEVYVKPNSKANTLSFEDGIFLATLKSKPIRGKASADLIVLLSKELGIDSSHFEMLTGKRGRIKILKVKDLSRNEMFAKIKAQQSRTKQ